MPKATVEGLLAKELNFCFKFRSQKVLPNSPWQMSVLLAPSMMNCGFSQISCQREEKECWIH